MSDLPETLQRNPDLDRWIEVHADGTIEVRSGKVELGQGIKTALTAIAADELDVDPARIRLTTADTARAPNELLTVGSMSVEVGGAALRQAMAQARHVLLARAAQALGTSLAALHVNDGVVGSAGANRTVSYADLAAGVPFAVRMTTAVAEKPLADYRWVGRGLPRVDLPAKVRGEGVFVHDLSLPGMVHGRVLRPPSLRHRLADIDSAAIEALPDLLALVRNGTFVALLAQREEHAVALCARAQQHVRWEVPVSLLGAAPDEDLAAQLLGDEQAQFLLRDGAPTDDPVPPSGMGAVPPGSTAHRAQYSRPFQMHASLGPSAALAVWRPEEGDPSPTQQAPSPGVPASRLTVWCASQGVEVLRLCLAQVMAVAADDIRVVHVEGAGGYGHNGADDVALDAALAARAVPGRPVLLKWSRRDEHCFEPYGPAMHVQLGAVLDAAGAISYWSHDVWSYTHSGRPMPASGFSNLLAAWHLDPPVMAITPRPARGPHVGIHRNADPLYAFPARRVVKHFCGAPPLDRLPLRTSSLRGLGAFGNVFAIESFMDELAHDTGQDPIAFRLRHLTDWRAGAVVETLRDWVGPLAQASGRSGERVGRGIAFARYKNRQTYAAVAIELAVHELTAAIRLLRAWIVADAGRVVDPDGVVNQLEGGLIQAASWTLKEEVQYDASGVTSVDWATYPILRFDEVPEVATRVLQRQELPSLGAGEATAGPTPAAIANAVFAATGLRLRTMPFKPERLRQAAAGAA